MPFKNIQKVILTGPESTGKTTLTQQLAVYFDTVWVPEFSRTYLNDLKRPYREDDLVKIAKGHRMLERFYEKKANRFLFCDTSILVMKIWSEFGFGKCHPWILEEWKNEKEALFVLCATEVPWESDPQREHEHQREELHVLYKKSLVESDKNFIEVSGNQSIRLDQVVKTLHKISF